MLAKNSNTFGFHRLVILLMILATVIAIVHIAVTQTLVQLAEEHLHPDPEKGIHFSRSHINLFTGNLVIEDFVLEQANKTRLQIDELQLNLSPTSLIRSEPHMTELKVSGGELHLIKGDNGQWLLPFPPAETAQSTETEAEIAIPAVKIDLIDVTNFQLTLQQAKQQLPVKIQRVKLTDFDSTKEHKRLDLDFILRGAKGVVEGDGQLDLTHVTKGQFQWVSELSLSDLDLEQLNPWLQIPGKVQGKLDLLGQFAVSEKELRLFGQLEWSKAFFQQQAFQLRGRYLSAKDFDIKLPYSNLAQLAIDLKAQISAKQLDLKQNSQKIQIKDLQLEHFKLVAKPLASTLKTQLYLTDLSAKSDVQKISLKRLESSDFQLKQGKKLALSLPDTLKLQNLNLENLFLNQSFTIKQLALKSDSSWQLSWFDEQIDLQTKSASAIQFEQISGQSESGENFALQKLEAKLQPSSFNWAGDQLKFATDLVIDGQGWQLKRADQMIDLAQLSANFSASSDGKISAVKGQLSPTEAVIRLGETKTLRFAKADAQIDQLDTDQIALSQLNFQALNWQDANLTPKNVTLNTLNVVQPSYRFGDQALLIKQIHLLGLASGSVSDIQTQLEALAINNIAYQTEQSLSIDQIHLESFQTSIARTQQGQWKSPFAYAVETRQTQKINDDASKKPDLAVKIGKIRLTGKNKIHFADQFEADGIKKEFLISELILGEINNTDLEQETPISLKLKPDEYSELNLQGQIRPFANERFLQLSGELSHLNLQELTPYVRKALGHKFLAGDLDDAFKLKLNGSFLEMDNEIVVRGFEVESIPEAEGPPLGTAIAILEKSDGRIELSVPVKGDLENPEFKVSAALDHIIMKAAVTGVALAIQPLGSVVAVGALLASEAMTVRFQPAEFEPASETLVEATQDYLDQLAKKLTDRPKFKVRLCGHASRLDLPPPPKPKRDKDGKPLPVEPGMTPDQQQAYLVDLAKARAAQVRAYLAQKGLDKTRLKNCRPVVKREKEDDPRVEIGL